MKSLCHHNTNSGYQKRDLGITGDTRFVKMQDDTEIFDPKSKDVRPYFSPHRWDF